MFIFKTSKQLEVYENLCKPFCAKCCIEKKNYEVKLYGISPQAAFKSSAMTGEKKCKLFLLKVPI